MRHKGIFTLCFLAVAACVDASSNGGGSSGVAEPQFFIASSLGPACIVDERGQSRSISSVKNALDRLYANNLTYISQLRRSTSLTPGGDGLQQTWKPILFNSYAAVAANDEALTRTIIEGMKRLAASGRYMNEPEMLTMAEAKGFGLCYRNGPSTPCPQHLPRFVARMYTNLLIAMAVLDSRMTDGDRDVIVPWLKRGYQTFVAPELAANQGGIYDFANYGMARLALAALTNDKGLASHEINTRRRDFLNHIEASGYITENSYRGERAFWYHTAGLDPALSYAIIAREWGVDFFRDPALGPRLRAAVDKTVLGTKDYAAFRSVGNRGNAYTTDPRDRIADVHQFALNLIPIAAREYGVPITPGARFKNLSRIESYTQTSGFSARCYYSKR
jgi:hypothetical protein